MTKARLEAFTDGIVAIVITILVLEIDFPLEPTWRSILALRDTLSAYIVSFIFVAVIWVTHHRLFRITEQINDRVIWANIFWLFWLTLCPAVTRWVGENPEYFWPEFCYVFVYTMWSFSFGILAKQVLKANGPKSVVVKTVKDDHRSAISMVINLALLAAVFFVPEIGLFGRFLVTALWIPSFSQAIALQRKLKIIH